MQFTIGFKHRGKACHVTVEGEDRRTLGPGDFYGEIALIDGGTRTATITATSDGVAHGLTKWQFKPLIEMHG